MELPIKPDETPTLLFNPSKEDFTYPLATDEGQQFYTLPSRKIVTFPKYIADHLAKHLAQELTSKEHTQGGSQYEQLYKKNIEKIYIKL